MYLLITHLIYYIVYSLTNIQSLQFVPFRDFMKGGNFCENQAALAKEVLAEIPEQLLSFMTSHNIRPASAK